MKKQTKAIAASVRELHLSENGKPRLKRFTLSSRQALQVRELTTTMGAAFTAFCPITGLPVTFHDLPPLPAYDVPIYHPFSLNALSFLDVPSYIGKLSNSQLAGLILGLLDAAGKLSFKRGTTAMLARLKIELVLERNHLLDFIEWIANSLLKTQLYYSPLIIDYKSLNLLTLADYMDSTYSLETYSFEGSTPELITEVAPPKQWNLSDFDKVQKRLDKAIYSTWTELKSELLEQPRDYTKLIAKGELLFKSAASRFTPASITLAELLYQIKALPVDDLTLLSKQVEAAKTNHDKQQAEVLKVADSLDLLLTNLNPEPATEPEPEPEQAPEQAKAKPLTLRERLAARANPTLNP